MKFVIILWLYCVYNVYTMEIHSATHWMVTETGLIQPKIDSYFEMARPYDLLSFLNQDIRWDNIRKMYYDLRKRHIALNDMWLEIEQNSDISTHLANDKNCRDAGQQNSIDWFTSHLEDGSSKIPRREFLLYIPGVGQNVKIPDCKKISSLTFSMVSFEHLESLMHRENLTASPEISLPEQISPIMTVDQFAHWIAIILQRNTSSWLHYNMASLYWRVVGNAPKAVECSRRAIHYAPRQYKDIALLSMGTTLHRSKRTEDAIYVLEAAVDHDPLATSNHFMLANAYAVAGRYNVSLKHFDYCLKLNPGLDLAVKHKRGVLCHENVAHKAKIVKNQLTSFRAELKEFGVREANWLQTQEAFLRTMKHRQEFDFRNTVKNCEKMQELTGLEIIALKKECDKNSLIAYYFNGPLYKEEWLTMRGVYAIDGIYNLQRLVGHITKHASSGTLLFRQAEDKKLSDAMLMKEIGPMPVPPDLNKVKLKKVELRPVSKPPQDDFFELYSGIPLYPPSMKINRTAQDFDSRTGWPPEALCKDSPPDAPDNVDAVFPVFMPFENKGIKLKTLLTDKIGVPASVEHELPWHPPTCPPEKEAAAYSQKKSPKQVSVTVVPTNYLRQKLLQYVGDGDTELANNMQDAEIGQRIYAAMQMNLAPKWLSYTLSSLYWRVRGNNINALNCLMGANRPVKARFKDLVLASLASVYLEMGYFDEALAAAEEAFRLSLYEPATNFLLAELSMVKKHRSAHIFHLKQVLRVDPDFMNGLARNLFNDWTCILLQVNALQDAMQGDIREPDSICSKMDPTVKVVCDESGANCRKAEVQCLSGSERESSTIVRMLEQKVDSDEHTSNFIDGSIFSPFTENMPTALDDRAGHYKNFHTMMKIIDKELMGCGHRGCSSIIPEDFALNAESCVHQPLQLGYWLHIVSFRQIMAETDFKLPAETIASNTPGKKIPECHYDAEPSDDFFLERLTRVDSEGWEPVLSFMHQFADILNSYDYTALGTRIAKYVENKPRSWVVAMSAGWWCGAGGRGACAVRCFSAAYALAPPAQAPQVMRALAAILHMQTKLQDAKDVTYLAFYMLPNSKIEAFLAGVSHTYLGEYDQAAWMYRYALRLDVNFLPAKACLHAAICMMLFGENKSIT